jgi:hypothetical protein
VTAITLQFGAWAVVSPRNADVRPTGGVSEMAYVASYYRDGYPKLTDFVANELPNVTHNPRVFSAFIKYAEYTKYGGIWVLQPYMDPAIHIEPLNGRSQNGDYTYSEYRPDLTGYIYLDTDWAQRFERDYQKAEARRLMEACLLHEMCHRGDHDDGVDQGEPGEAFEIEAYGALQQKYW